MTEQEKSFKGPIEDTVWPDKLRANAIEPGAAPRIHGYDAYGDLARHYSFSEMVLIALNGEIPDEQKSRGFEVALKFLMPLCIAQAPSHAAVVARLCGANSTGTIGMGALGLAELARYQAEKHAAIWAWLQDPASELPAELLAKTPEDKLFLSALRLALEESNCRFEALERDLSADAAMLALLYQCGISTKEQLATVFVVARLPGIAAEVAAVKPAAFREYPMDLPPYRYTE